MKATENSFADHVKLLACGPAAEPYDSTNSVAQLGVERAFIANMSTIGLQAVQLQNSSFDLDAEQVDGTYHGTTDPNISVQFRAPVGDQLFAAEEIPNGMGKILTPGGRPLGAAGDPDSGLLYVADGTAGLSIIDLYSPGGTRDRINLGYASTPDNIDDRVLGSVSVDASQNATATFSSASGSGSGTSSYEAGRNASFSSTATEDQITAAGTYNVEWGDPDDPRTITSASDSGTLNGSTASTSIDGNQITTTTPGGRTIQTTTDAAGRPQSVQLPGLPAIAIGYTGGRVSSISQGGRSLGFGYAGAAVSSITGPLGSVNIGRDTAGDPTSVTSPGESFGITPDNDGNIDNVSSPQDADYNESASYNPVDYQLTDTVPAGQISVSYSLDRIPNGGTSPWGALTFDAHGNLTGVGDVTLQYTRDHLTKVTTPDGVIDYGYGGAAVNAVTTTGPVTGSVGIGRNATFQATSMSVGGTTISRTVDPDGVVTQVGAMQLDRSNDASFLEGTTLSGTYAVTDTYDNLNAFGEPGGYTAKVDGQTVFQVTYTRDAASGRITGKTEQIIDPTTGDLESTVSRTYEFDGANRLKNIYSGSTLLAHHTYDDHGNRGGSSGCGVDPGPSRTPTGSYTPSRTPSQTATVTWTPGGPTATPTDAPSLTATPTATDPPPTATPTAETPVATATITKTPTRTASATATATVDAESCGSGGSGVTTNIVVTGDNQLTKADVIDPFGVTHHYEYTYTNGALATKVESPNSQHSTTLITSYSYDLWGNLRSVTLPDSSVITYLIDAANHRVGKDKDGQPVQRFLYAGGLLPVAELDASNSVTGVIVYGSKGNVPDYIKRGSTTYRLISDHLGSVRLVINTNTGVVEQRMDYDEWGNVLLDTNPGFQPFGYAGGLYDPDTGLVRFGARDYDPAIGRWTARDPIGFGGGQGNVYTYVGNDPGNFSDPSGLYHYVKEQEIGPVSPCRNTFSTMAALQGDPNAIFPFWVIDRSANISGWQCLMPRFAPQGPLKLGSTYDLLGPRGPFDGCVSGNGVTVTELDATSFVFTTDQTHFDGAGATIKFETFERNGSVYLRHTGDAPNASWYNDYFAPRGATYFTWPKQADKLRAYIDHACGAGR